MSSVKVAILPWTVGVIKFMSLCKMSPYFPKLYERSNGNVMVELDLCNYVTKTDLKEATGVYISKHQNQIQLVSKLR